MRLPHLVLLGSAAAYGSIGGAFLAAPASMARLVGVELTSITADNDVRAVYGGLAFGLAVFFGIAAGRRDWWRPALWVLLLSAGGMACARVVSWVLIGMPDPIAFGLHAAEIIGVAAAGLALSALASPEDT
jgi:hypothetical protein